MPTTAEPGDADREPKTSRLADVFRRGIELLRDGADQVRALLNQHLGAGVLEDLSRGELWLPQQLLEAGLSESLPPGVQLQRLTCTAEGIRPTVEVRKCGAAWEATGLIRVEAICVTADRQELTVRMEDLDLTGTNWLGWLVAPIATAILRRTYGERLVELGKSAELPIRPAADNPNRFTVDLAGLDQVQTLKTKQVLGRSLLNFVQISGCRHAEAGLYLQGTIQLT